MLSVRININFRFKWPQIFYKLPYFLPVNDIGLFLVVQVLNMPIVLGVRHLVTCSKPVVMLIFHNTISKFLLQVDRFFWLILQHLFNINIKLSFDEPCIGSLDIFSLLLLAFEQIKEDLLLDVVGNYEENQYFRNEMNEQVPNLIALDDIQANVVLCQACS